MGTEEGGGNTRLLVSQFGILVVTVAIITASPLVALGDATAGGAAAEIETGGAAGSSDNAHTTENSSRTSATATNSSAAATDPQNHTAVGDSLARTVGSGSGATESAGASRNDEDGSTRTVTVTVRTRAGTADAATDVVRDHGRVIASAGTRVTAEVPVSALTDVANASAVRFVRKPAPGQTLDTGGEDEIKLTDLRNRTDDFTGENVTVAVIDLEPFTDASEADVAYSPEQVTERRNTINGSIDSHGTKTAETVAEVAPNASLRLIDIDSYTDLISEIEYLRTQTETDVISISLGFLATDRQDGEAAVDAEIAAFVKNGGVYVTAAGNQADNNALVGSYQDGDNDDVLNVTSETELVNVTKPDSGEYSVFLQWNDWTDRNTDYELEVVNASGSVIRESDNLQDGNTADPVERVLIKSSDDNPHIRITYDDTSGAPDEVLTLASFDAEFTPSTSARTVTVPSTEETALTVGAYGPAARDDISNRLERFSSRGPTIDGDRKPEVVGPDGTITTSTFSTNELQFGTSYAAPHVAGVVALGMSANDSFGGTEAVQTVQNTAQPIRGDEPNNQTGYGLVDAEALLETVEAESPSVSNASALDASDGDTVVTAKDNVSVTTTASDALEVASVTANASAFGAGTVTLTDENNDEVYNATFAVDESAAAADDAYNITVTATDGAGNTNTTQTNTLTLNTSDQTPPALTDATAIDLDGGNVTEDDSITLNATVTDTGSGVASVTANTSAFGVESVALTDGDDDSVYNATFAVNASTAAADDSYRITITATDGAGNTNTTQTDPLTLDTSDQTPPALTDATAVDLDGGNVTADDEIRLNATVTDADSGVANVTANASAFGVDSVTLTDENNDTVYNATVAVNASTAAADGTYRINITATDRAGNQESAQTGSLTLDTADETPPSLTGVTAVDLDGGNVTANDEIKLNATVTDTDSGVANVTANASAFGVDSVTLTDENSDAIYNTTFSVNVSNAAADGAYSITITATDDAGNQESAQTGSLTLDTSDETPPSIDRVTAVDLDGGNVTADDEIRLNATVTDADSGVANVTANASAFGLDSVTLTDPDGDAVYNATFAVNASAAAVDGTYRINITATDGAGNQESVLTDSLTLDTADETPPSLTGVTAVDLDGGNVTADDEIKLNATVTDADSGVADVTANASAFGVDSVTLTDENNDTVYNATFAVNASTAAADGVYRINITATDSAGNTNSALTDSLTLDTADETSPSIAGVTAVDLDGGNVTADDEVKLNATVTDTDSGVANVTANASAFGVDSVTLTDVDGDAVYNATFAVNASAAAADGTYRINITATDGAGNQESVLTDSLTLDTADETPPLITGVTAVDLDGGNVTANDSITLNATVTDTGSGVASVTANASAFGVDSVTLTDADGDTVYNATFAVNAATAAADGTYRINITATDGAGNANSTLTDPLTLDTANETPPSLTRVTAVDLDGGNVTADDDIKLNATVTDADPGVATVTANASAFGVDSVALTDEDNDTVYNATFSVNATGAATNGTYTIGVTATDAAGNAVASETDGLPLRVRATDGDDGGGGSGGPAVGGGGGGGAPAPAPPAETTATPQPTTTPGEAQSTDGVTVETRNGTAVRVRVDEAARETTPADAPVTINAGITSESGSLGVTTVSLRTAEEAAYEASLSASDTMPTGMSAPAATTVGAITVAHTVPDEEILTTEFTVEVDKQQFDGTTPRASELSLYRLHNGEWTRLNTDVVEETAESVTLRAVSPGLSVFALGSTDSTVQVENASISNTRPFQGDTVSITADVINTGTADREVSVAFVVGEETTTKTVSLSAGASQKVTHTVSVPRGEGSPELDVYVNGTYVGLIDVVEQASTLSGSEEGVPTANTTSGTESPSPQPTTRETALSGGSESTTSSTGTPGFGVVAAVTALLVGLILFRQRSHE